MVFDFQDYRRLSTPVKSLPGDRLIAQCIYDSTSRQALTLGKCVSLQQCHVMFHIYAFSYM